MSNIITSDFFRLRRGAAMRNTVLALVGLVLLVVVIMIFSQSEAFTVTVLEGGQELTAAEMAEMQQDVLEAQNTVQDMNGAAGFGFEMLAQFFVPLFFLPIVLAVFCADFTAGTYRNTLSYESNRTRVYMAKLALSTVLCLGLVLVLLVASWLFAAIPLGLAGFTAAYFGKLLTVLALQLPVYLAYVAVCHFLVAFTKKSSATIAVFVVGLLVLSMGIQLLTSSIPGIEWLMLLDPMTSGRLLAQYGSLALQDILIILGYNVAITAGATALGIAHYRRADMP